MLHDKQAAEERNEFRTTTPCNIMTGHSRDLDHDSPTLKKRAATFITTIFTLMVGIFRSSIREKVAGQFVRIEAES